MNYNSAKRTHIKCRLLSVVTGMNLAGIACFCATTQASLTRQSLAGMSDATYVLQTLAFTLMLPGIFFGAATFLCARLFAWNEGTAYAVWYATGFAINFIMAWRAGASIESA